MFEWSGWVVGVVSLVLTVVYYLWQKREMIPCYALKNWHLVGKSLMERAPQVSIKFTGHADSVENVSVCKLVIWNRGRMVIKKDDVVKEEPFQIVANGCDILDVVTVQEVQPSNHFSVSVARDCKTATISFAHMPHHDGLVLDVFHTGSSQTDIAVRGRLKDGHYVQRIRNVDNATRLLGWFVDPLVIAVFGTMALPALYPPGTDAKQIIPDTLSWQWAVFVGVVLVGALLGSCVRMAIILLTPAPPKHFTRYWE